MRRNVTVMLGLTLLFMFLLANGVIGRLEGALLFAGSAASSRGRSGWRRRASPIRP